METFESGADAVLPHPPANEGEPFALLAARAEEFVVQNGGSAPEDLLINHVFGSAGSPLLWRPLLRNVLSHSENLSLRADGAWLLKSAGTDSLQSLLSEFTVVDVETTGLQASRQRIIEIAVVRFSGGSHQQPWVSFCQPGRRIPAYIVKLTGIDDEMVKDAPAFGDVAGTLVDLLEDVVVVGHNIDFDLAFINEELKRVGRPPLVNERLDTLALASRLIPSLRRPTLQSVAEKLGLNPGSRGQHRAGRDALLTGMVATTLIDQAQQAGFRSYEDLKTIVRPVTRRPRERMPRAHSVVDRSLLKDVPRAPGVYLMRDAADRVVYVGKAKNLRDRVGSYFSQPLGYTRKMDGLIESLSRIQTEVVGSELEALLLESQLIRRYQPRYNTALRSHEQYPFIRVDIGNAWPRISLAKARKDDGARYFGPFRNAATARKTVDLINRAVPLRTCTRSFRDARSYGSPCLELDLGRCLGPCVGRANRDEYLSLVRGVIDYIDGRDQALLEILWKSLESAAAQLDFERAARVRRDVQSSLALTVAQRRLRESTEQHWLVLVLPSRDQSAREALLITGGQLWAQLRFTAEDGVDDVASRLEQSWRRYRARGLRPPDHDSVDDMHILSSWLGKHEGHPALVRFDPLAEPEWRAIGGRVMTAAQGDLDFDLWRKGRDAIQTDWDDLAVASEDTLIAESEAAMDGDLVLTERVGSDGTSNQVGSS
ncbi:MAG: exonuclease domain-containing protein [Thermomicrobiales bacterium]